MVAEWCRSMGKRLSYFGDIQVFRICSYCDSGLNFNAHQHVWQYRDSALAWGRLKPSALLSDRKDKTGLANIRISKGRLSEEHDLHGNLALCAYAETIKLLDALVRNLWSGTESNLVSGRQGLRAGGWGVIANGYRVSGGGDENVLKLCNGDNCTSL